MKIFYVLLLLTYSQVYSQDDCIFDQSTQTDEFIKDIKEFHNYTWDDLKKEGTIILDNGDTLIATRGGCDHFGISGTLIQLTSELKTMDQKFIFEKGLWMAERLFDNKDFQQLKILIKNEDYRIEQYDDQRFFLYFNHEYFSEYYLLGKWYDGILKIEIGYYYS